ncbi:hypothetical protein Tco_0641955 [Tanacetum coccineum]
MFLNMDQLEKQLDKKEFQENGSIDAFRVLKTQIHKFINSQFSLDDDDGLMTHKAPHKREYDSRVNERPMQTKDGKVDTSKALDASLVDTYSSRIESEKQDTSSTSWNDANVDDADIKPVYDEEPMAEVQLTADNNVFATGQQHTEQLKFNNEGEVDQNAEHCHNIRPLPTKLTDNQITKLSNQSLKFENICLKKTVAQFQQDFSKLEVHCINLEL